MESNRCDCLTRTIAALTSRRAGVRGATLGGLAVAANLGTSDPDDANAKQKHKRARQGKARGEKQDKNKSGRTSVICHGATNDPATRASIAVNTKQRKQHLKHHGDNAGECMPGRAGVCQGAFARNVNQDTAGWTGIYRVASGAGGIPAKPGGFSTQAAGTASSTTGFTRWGGYSSVFPQGGYDSALAIYLDPPNTADGLQFDSSSAINQPNCNHRRDFIVHRRQ